MQSKQKVSFDAVEFTTTNDDNGKTNIKVAETFFENVDVDEEFHDQLCHNLQFLTVITTQTDQAPF
jgi:hypothetical protein